jgi:hypothetical protein
MIQVKMKPDVNNVTNLDHLLGRWLTAKVAVRAANSHKAQVLS